MVINVSEINNDRRTKCRTKKIVSGAICMLACFLAAAAVPGMYGGTACTVQASSQDNAPEGTGTAPGVGRVRSSGRVQYEYAVIDAKDLWEIDAYISSKKSAAADALVRLGTRFRLQSGEYTYDRNPDVGAEEIDSSGLSWAIITRAAGESQGVPEGLAVLHPETALQIEGVEERTDCYAAAVEDNLSAGKAAWVDGRLLLGNGADNDRAYRQGYKDGGEGQVLEQFRPIYGVRGSGMEIRHVHVGSAENREGTSGCYHNYSVTSSVVDRCVRPLEYMQAVWIPNGNEPDGGSWHGGFYSCSSHGGTYESPGMCSYEEVISQTEWRHDIACGRENMLYARLAIKEADTSGMQPVKKQMEEQQPEAQQPEAEQTNTEQQPDTETIWGRIHLEAVLEKGEGFDRLTWLSKERLVWTDVRGNVLGTGPGLTVFEPGIYRCSVNVSNADISGRMAEAIVIVSGLMAQL